MAGVRPVSLPISSEEVKFIQRRQAELSRQINLVDQKVRSGVYSKGQGVNRKMFLKSEVDELEYLKRSRRAPGSTPFTPFKLPQAPRAAGQSSKYQSTTTQSSGSTQVNRANKPYGTSTKPVTTGTKKTTIRDMPKHVGRPYGSIISESEKRMSGGYFYAYPIFDRRTRKTINAYYGPVNAKTTTIQNFRDWCKINLGKEYTHFRPAKSTTTSKTSYAKKSTPTPKLKIYKNPHGQSYGTVYSNTDKILTTGNYVMYGRTYYGPKHQPKDGWKRPIPLPSSNYLAKWNAWNKANGISSKKLSTPKPSSSMVSNVQSSDPAPSTSTRPRKYVNENPHSYNYGQTYSTGEKAVSWNKAKKYRGNYYGPKFTPKVTKTYFGKTVTLIPPAPNKKNLDAWNAWNKANFAGFEGRPVELIHKDAVKTRREATLIRARRGARMDINKQVRGQRKTPNWKSISNDKEKQMIQQALTQVGLSDMPKLTEKGNRVLVQAIRTNRIENPQKRMEVGARRMSRILTELINNSGYFSVKHKAKVSPSFPPQVQLSEMAGIAGGFSKTRNSMQRLLRK